MAKVKISNPFAKRKRVINAKELKFDMKENLLKLFLVFYDALKKFNAEIEATPLEARGRGFEASYFNAKLRQCVQNVFGESWYIGKYGRFLLNLNGYIVLFKKLDKNFRPMNIRTRLAEAISNQQMGNLFDPSDDGSEPIVFFGYRKDVFGIICEPQLVYIDEGKVRWRITEDYLSERLRGISVGISQYRSDLQKPSVTLKPMTEQGTI